LACEFVAGLLETDSLERPTAEQALQHSWITPTHVPRAVQMHVVLPQRRVMPVPAAVDRDDFSTTAASSAHKVSGCIAPKTAKESSVF
jgi:hypothetical protein